MLGPRHLPSALAAFDDAVAASLCAPGAQRRALRWLAAARSTPLALMGRWREASAAVESSLSLVEPDDPTGAAESCLLQARVLMATGRLTVAHDAVTPVACRNDAVSLQ